MKGLEMMLANLLGMKPDEMGAKVETAVSLMEQGARTAAKIENDLALIKAHLGIGNEETLNHGPGRELANGRSHSQRIEL